MRNEFNPLDVKASVAAGDAANTEDFGADKGVQLSGTFSATVQIEFSVNGTDYLSVGAALTAPGHVPIPQIAKRVRANTTVFVSGAPAATLGGTKDR